MVLLPLSEIVVRKAFGRGIPGSGPIVQHLTLWVGFLGAAIAARDGKLLALATGTFIPPGRWRRAADILAAAFDACAATLLGWGGYRMAAAEREVGTNIGAGIPTWIAQVVLPIAFVLIAVRLVWRAGGVTQSPDPRGATLRPFDELRVAPSPVEGREPQGRPEPGRGPKALAERSATADLTVTHPDDRSEQLTASRRGSVWIDRALASLGIAAGALFLLVPSILEG